MRGLVSDYETAPKPLESCLSACSFCHPAALLSAKSSLPRHTNHVTRQAWKGPATPCVLPNMTSNATTRYREAKISRDGLVDHGESMLLLIRVLHSIIDRAAFLLLICRKLLCQAGSPHPFPFG